MNIAVDRDTNLTDLGRNFLKNLRSVLALGLTCMSLYTSALAGVYTADFSGPTLDPNLGFVTAAVPNGVMIIGGGNLTTDMSLAHISSFGGVSYQTYINTDFTASVTVDVSKNAGAVAMFGFLTPPYVYAPYIDYGVTSVISSPFPTTYQLTGGVSGISAPAPQSGSGTWITGISGYFPIIDLQFQRSGNTFTGSFKTPNETNFHTFQTFDGSALAAGGELILGDVRWSQDYPNPVAKFSNFTITTVPEPTTLLLVGLGIAGIAAEKRRKR